MYKKIFIALVLIPCLGFAQIGPAVIIDSSSESAGVSQFAMVDIDNDGDKELVASFTGSIGKLGYYDNLGGGSFSGINIIDPVNFCTGVAVGDFDGDGWGDLIAVGGTNKEAWIYFNNSGTFGSGVLMDPNVNSPLPINDVVVADFDANTSDDIVIIGQHSIDFYRNDGNGNFTEEHILTTSTSTEVLECLDISTADVDNDGDMDIISGETAGLVVYFNSGNAVFTPQYYSTVSEVAFVVHPFDVNNDNNIDVMIRNGANDVKWFSNDGTGTMTFEATLTDVPKLLGMKSIDYNDDGFEDLYASYLFHISIFLNGPVHSFNVEIPVYQDNDLIMGPVYIGNIDNQSPEDYIWTGVNNTIAYHLNLNNMSVDGFGEKDLFSVFPNPTNGIVHIKNKPTAVYVYDNLGRLLIKSKNTDKIVLSELSNGIYYLVLEAGNIKQSYKIVKK